MASAAAGNSSSTSNAAKHDNMKSGLVGNIQGQDVEAAKTRI